MKQATGWIVGCLCVGTWAVGAVTADPTQTASVQRWSQLLGRSSEAIDEARGGILALPPQEAARVISKLLQSKVPSARDEGIWLIRRAPEAAVLLFGELIERTRSEDEVTRGTALRAFSTLAPAAARAGHPIIKVLLPHLQEGGACSVFAFMGLIELDLIDDRAL